MNPTRLSWWWRENPEIYEFLKGVGVVFDPFAWVKLVSHGCYHCRGFDSRGGDGGVLEMLQSWNPSSSCPVMLEQALTLLGCGGVQRR